MKWIWKCDQNIGTTHTSEKNKIKQKVKWVLIQKLWKIKKKNNDRCLCRPTKKCGVFTKSCFQVSEEWRCVLMWYLSAYVIWRYLYAMKKIYIYIFILFNISLLSLSIYQSPGLFTGICSPSGWCTWRLQLNFRSFCRLLCKWGSAYIISDHFWFNLF